MSKRESLNNCASSENNDDSGISSEKQMKMCSLEKGILLGYGNPLLDITVQANTEYLKKYGLEANNAILAEDKHKVMYEEMVTLFKDSVEYTPGGATLNTIRLCQWILGLPEATAYFGCIARDNFGDILTKSSKAAGVDVQFQYTDKEPTGTCAVICTNKDRSLVANLAAANCFSEDHLDEPESWATVERAKYFYFGGYPLTVCPSAMVRIAKFASENDRIVAMNMSAPFLCSFFKEPMLQMLPYVDYFFGNETELDEFAKANNLGTTDRKEIALKISQWEKVNKARSRIVIITQGSSPSLVVADNTVKEYPVIPIVEKDIVDTNAAGDAFVGGFLAQLVKGQSLDECMNCANYIGNMIIQQLGCTFPEKCGYQSKTSN